MRGRELLRLLGKELGMEKVHSDRIENFLWRREISKKFTVQTWISLNTRRYTYVCIILSLFPIKFNHIYMVCSENAGVGLSATGILHAG